MMSILGEDNVGIHDLLSEKWSQNKHQVLLHYSFALIFPVDISFDFP